MSDQYPGQDPGEQPGSPYPPPPPPYGQAPGAGGPPPPPQWGGGYQAYPEGGDHSQATTILVLGILSLVCCGLFTGIPAIVMGKKALNEIDAARGAIGGRSTVKAGWICGIIGTTLSALGLAFYAVVIVIAISTGDFDSMS